MSVQFCGSCGKPLIPGQLFCQHCGARNDENATRAEAISPAPSRTPGGTLYCGQCGFLLSAQDHACRRCGTPVDFPNALIADAAISDAPTVGVRLPDAQASLQTQGGLQTQGTAAPAVGYPSPPPAPTYNPPAGPLYQPPVGSPSGPPLYPQYSAPPQQSAPYDAPTFSTGVGYGQPPAAPRAAPGYSAGPPPNYPAPPPQKSRLPLIVGLVIVAILLIAGGGAVLALRSGGSPQANGNPTATTAPNITPTTAISPSPTMPPSPTQVVLTPDTASALIQQFYAYINARNFDAAYDLLSTAFQQKQSRQSFDSGFQTTVQDTLTIQGAKPLADGSVEVDITLVAVDNKNGTQVTTIYTGYYIVILENGALRIFKGKLTAQG